MIRSATAERLKLSNEPPPDLEAALMATSWLAEEARAILGVPCAVGRGYSSWAVHAAVYKAKGLPVNKSSVHPLGLAVDLHLQGLEIRAALDKLRAHAAFMAKVDQMIEERGCLHLGRPRPGTAARHQVKVEVIKNGIATYPLLEAASAEPSSLERP
jgi:hypothetical protein